MDRICDTLGPWRPNDLVKDHAQIMARELYSPTPECPVGILADMLIARPAVRILRIIVFPGVQYGKCNVQHHLTLQQYHIWSDEGITMGQLADFIQSKLLQCGCDTVVRVSLLEGFKSSCSPMLPCTLRWEVRKGKVYRQIRRRHPVSRKPTARTAKTPTTDSRTSWILMTKKRPRERQIEQRPRVSPMDSVVERVGRVCREQEEGESTPPLKAESC